MTENIDPRTDPQFQALKHVMDEITQNKVPLRQPWELAARSTLRELQHQIDDHNALDDGELIDVLNQARIEIKYLLSIITDLDARVKERDAEVSRLERWAHRAN
jgi:hypothetical protein